MTDISLIEYTVVSERLLESSTEDYDVSSSVQNYIDALMDSIEGAYPNSRVVVIEVRPGVDLALISPGPAVQAGDGIDTSDIVQNVEALAMQLRDARSWCVSCRAA